MGTMKLKLPPRYALEGADPVLGEGGMGRVVRARDTVLDVPVALKVVRPELAADPRFAARFDLEVRIAARFTHRHIVPLHDLGNLADGTPFPSAFFLPGVSMAKKDVRPVIKLECTECRERNYHSQKNRRNDPQRLELKKYCPRCKTHTMHRETK